MPGEVEESVCSSPCHPRPHKVTWPAALCTVRASVCDTPWKGIVCGIPWRVSACVHRVTATSFGEDRESLLGQDCALWEACQQSQVLSVAVCRTLGSPRKAQAVQASGVNTRLSARCHLPGA